MLSLALLLLFSSAMIFLGAAVQATVETKIKNNPYVLLMSSPALYGSKKTFVSGAKENPSSLPFRLTAHKSVKKLANNSPSLKKIFLG
jgi:hypothetical protein